MFRINQIQAAATSQEGLPFWLFWFLVGLIALLVFFIFLRDKDLRRRIDFFFLSAKNRSLQIHLRRQLNREKKRKERLWLELGRIVYEKRINIKGTETMVKTIASLERKKEELLSQLDYFPRIPENLSFIPASAQPAGPELNNPLPKSTERPDEARIQLNGKKAKTRIARKKKQGKLEGKINDLERQINNLLITLGRTADTLRLKEEKLLPLYEKIDAANLRLSHLEQRLDSPHPF
jgi:chromosome segregation ATPase